MTQSIRLRPVDLSNSGWDETSFQKQNDQNGLGQESNALLTPLTSLTTEAVDGSGAFDSLMRATKLHLLEEYNAQRITGAEYATVYLGALAAVLQTSVQFLLNEQQAHQIAAEVGLIRQKTVTELVQTDDSIPIGLGFNHIPLGRVPVPKVTVPEVLPE